MSIPKRLRERMLEFCGSLSDEDGLNPRDDQSIHINRKQDTSVYRQRRLCRQITETLMLAISDAPDPLVANAKVLLVRPRKANKSVTVRVAVTDDVDQRLLQERLKGCEGWLRSEIAAAISRKRVPRLIFEITRVETGDSRPFGGDNDHDS